MSSHCLVESGRALTVTWSMFMVPLRDLLCGCLCCSSASGCTTRGRLTEVCFNSSAVYYFSVCLFKILVYVKLLRWTSLTLHVLWTNMNLEDTTWITLSGYNWLDICSANKTQPVIHSIIFQQCNIESILSYWNIMKGVPRFIISQLFPCWPSIIYPGYWFLPVKEYKWLLFTLNWFSQGCLFW